MRYHRIAALIVFGIYVLTAVLGLHVHAQVSPSTTLIWIPSGFSVAALLVLGRWAIIPVFIASTTINALTGVVPVYVTPILAAGNCIEYLIVSEVARRALDQVPDPRARIQRIDEIAFATIIGCAFAASVGAGTLSLTGHLDDFWEGWKIWWAGDALGILVFAGPCYMILSRLEEER